ncbi:hypothetical protein BTUL_0033g00280 [Botrytis tulipae]|uniref:Uncharacterized protein n=1 Tax=Botrytis tulipae TaxID=87230 RepID=A0A4Z1EWW4_9HELO|nr:hypothetical protein BTUL_0033g00280 [Botrytis tulipae]
MADPNHVPPASAHQQHEDTQFDHNLRECGGSHLDRFNFLIGCPVCCEATHLIEHCTFRPLDPQGILYYLVIIRDGKAPFVTSIDINSLPGFEDITERPLTPPRAAKVASLWKYHKYKDEKGYLRPCARDPIWSNAENVTILHPILSLSLPERQYYHLITQPINPATNDVLNAPVKHVSQLAIRERGPFPYRGPLSSKSSTNLEPQSFISKPPPKQNTPTTPMTAGPSLVESKNNKETHKSESEEATLKIPITSSEHSKILQTSLSFPYSRSLLHLYNLRFKNPYIGFHTTQQQAFQDIKSP